MDPLDGHWSRKPSAEKAAPPPRCAHTQRDGRCGFCGPKLTAKALELTQEVLTVGDTEVTHTIHGTTSIFLPIHEWLIFTGSMQVNIPFVPWMLWVIHIDIWNNSGGSKYWILLLRYKRFLDTPNIVSCDVVPFLKGHDCDMDMFQLVVMWCFFLKREGCSVGPSS